MKIRLNLVPKLTLVFVLFAALVLAVVSMLVYSSGRSALEAAAIAELYSTAIEKQSALNAWVAETQAHAASLSSSAYLQDKTANLLAARASGDQAGVQASRDSLVAELQAWSGPGLEYLGWLVLEPESGQVIASTDPAEEGRFREDQPYFINGKLGPYLQNLYYSPSTQGVLLTVSAPIRSGQGELVGVLAGNVDLATMNAILLRRTGLRYSNDAFLVNTSELFVTQPRFVSDPAVLLRGVHTQAVKSCLARNSGVVKAPDYRGVPSIIVYRWLPERQLCLIVKMDQEEALAPALVLRNNILFISLLALMAAALLAWLLARTITRPVQQLARAAQEIGAGKLDTPIKATAGDEIGLLAGALARMTGNLQKIMVSRDELRVEVAERRQAEISLHETNEYLDNLFNYANAPIIVWDPQFKITRFNHAFETLTGRSSEQVLGKQLNILFPPAQVNDSLNLIQQTLTGERWEIVEINILHVDGSVRTVLWNSATLFSAGGKIPLATIAQGQDITERIQAEKEIQRLSRFPAENPNPVLRVDKAGCILYANQTSAPLLANWGREVGQELPEDWCRQVTVVLDSGVYQEVEIDCQGHIFSCILSPVAEEGYVNIYGRDITDRKFAENMIESRLRLVEFAAQHSLEELLQKTLDEVCAITDSPIGFYHFVEPDQKTLSLQAWSTRTLQEYCQAEGKGLHYDVDQAGVWVDCIRQRQPIIHNNYASLPQRKGLPPGHAALVRELVVPILRGGLIVAILGVGNRAQDYIEKDIDTVAYFADVAWEIAERKRAEQQLASYTENLEEKVAERTRQLHEAQEKLVRQERLATLGQVAGSIGHELRNPLGVISNAVYFLKMSQPDASDIIKEYLQIIENETRTSDKFISELLDFTRIKATDRQPVLISGLVHQTLERYPVPPAVEVILNIPPDLPLVYADPQHVVQVLGNLTVNACQAMEKGGKLTLSAGVQGDMIRIAVQDTGTGILPADMGKLFEPLFTTKIKGIGLGLAVCRKLAEANGGRIEVQSEPGHGSTFSLYLPAGS